MSNITCGSKAALLTAHCAGITDQLPSILQRLHENLPAVEAAT